MGREVKLRPTVVTLRSRAPDFLCPLCIPLSSLSADYCAHFLVSVTIRYKCTFIAVLENHNRLVVSRSVFLREKLTRTH
jgi:hypothetical protein